MTMTMTRGRESTVVGPRLLVAFELSERTWKLGFTIGHAQGEDRVWRVVRVPSESEEDERHLHRLRERLQQERTRMINRLHGWLATQGVEVPLACGLPRAVDPGPALGRDAGASRHDPAIVLCGPSWSF